MNKLLLHFIVALLLTGITTVILGFFVYFKNPKLHLNKIFTLYSFSIAWWALAQAMLITRTNDSLGYWWNNFELVAVWLVPSLFLNFVLILLNLRKKTLLVICYIMSGLFICLIPSNLMVKNVVPILYTRYWTEPGIAYTIALLFFICVIIYGHFKLLTSLLESKGEKRNQMKYLFWGSLLGYIGGASNFFISYNISIPVLVPFGVYMVPIYAASTAYAIVKHHLFDINIVIRKSIIYSFLLTLITIGYFLLIFLMERLFHGFIGYKSLPWTLFIACLFILVFQPLKNRIQSFVDKYFFKGTLEAIAQEKETLFEALKQSDKMKAIGILAAGITHEIKNPLTSIKTFVDYLEERHNEPEFRMKFRQIVGGEIDKINTLTQQLLDFSKPQKLNLKDTDIHTVLDESLEFMKDALLSRNIQVVRQFDLNAPRIKADPNQLKQVFLNLFLNAADAMPAGGSLAIKTIKNESHFNIYVIDTGKGMTKEQISSLFSPFYTNKDNGTGLGLSVSEAIVKEHNGEIEVSSTPNAGSVFVVKLKIER